MGMGRAVLDSIFAEETWYSQEWNLEFGSNKVRKKSAGKDFKKFRGSA